MCSWVDFAFLLRKGNADVRLPNRILFIPVTPLSMQETIALTRPSQNSCAIHAREKLVSNSYFNGEVLPLSGCDLQGFNSINSRI